LAKIVLIFSKIFLKKTKQLFTSHWRSFLDEVVVLQEGVGLLGDVHGPGFPRRLHLVGQGYIVGPEQTINHFYDLEINIFNIKASNIKSNQSFSVEKS
jgi:hypothetical protein